MPSSDGGLGAALVGEKLMVNHRHVAVTRLLGEGGFSYVYLVKEIADTSTGQSLNNTTHGESVQRSGSGSGSRSSNGGGSRQQQPRQGSMGRGEAEKKEMVLKVTSILSRQQRDIAEKEAKLLSRLSHPSIIKMFDTCYRSVVATQSGRKQRNDEKKERPQHLILMEFCEGGQALEVCAELVENGERFDLSTLIIAFGQICNAVSYLHAQRPPIVHRDLKPANFLVKNGAYKLCDFGSAVFGHVDLKTPQARSEAEEVIEKTTTQMFRAPEMVDLFMVKKLTQATDVWALGCCLYSLAFLQNCFEEGSNLAILSRKYKIPDDNPYGDGLVELIDRMLTEDSKARADMTEVILCLSAVYSGRPLPPRKEPKPKKPSKEREEKDQSRSPKSKKKINEKAGTYNTTAQGLYGEDLTLDPEQAKKPAQAQTLNKNSAAYRRIMAAKGVVSDMEFSSFHSRFDEKAAVEGSKPVNQEMAFSTTDNPFAAFDSKPSSDKGSDVAEGDIFGSFDAEESGDGFEGQEWGNSEGFDAFATFSPDAGGDVQMSEGSQIKRRRSKGTIRRQSRGKSGSQTTEKDEMDEIIDAVESLGTEETLENFEANAAENEGSSCDNDDPVTPGSSRARRAPSVRSGRVRRTASNSEAVRRSSKSEGGVSGAVRRTISTREHGAPRRGSRGEDPESNKPSIPSNA